MNEHHRFASVSDRLALEESVSREELEFLGEHARACEQCRAESRLYDWMQSALSQGELGNMPSLAPGVIDRIALDPRGYPQEKPSRKAPLPSDAGMPIAVGKGRRFGSIFRAASLLALGGALAAGIVVSFRPGTPGSLGQPENSQGKESNSLASDSPKNSALALGSVRPGMAEIQIDGKTVSAETPLLSGMRLRTLDKAACIELLGGVRACLDSATEVRLMGVATGKRTLFVEQGSVAVKLAKQPEGRSFSLGTPHGEATAIGTQFGVMVKGGRSVVELLEGVIEISSAGRGLARMDRPQVARLSLPTPGASGEGELEPDEHLPEGLTRLVWEDLEEGVVETGSSKAPQRRSPGELLSEARAFKAAGDVGGARTTFARLLREHPSSPEAHLAHLPLAELELQLGKPKRAEELSAAYLKRGGSLNQEAAYTQIQALQTMGQMVIARARAEDFVRRYPQSLRARLLAKEYGLPAPPQAP